MTMLNEGDRSPWGTIQEVYPVMEGMEFITTPGHGGLKLSRALNAKMPHYLRNAGGWYEEDCDWAKPFCVFEKEILATPGIHVSHITAIQKEYHKKMLRGNCPDEFERFYGVTLKPGESYARDRANFEKAHANDFVVISALRHPNKDLVTCIATIGGSRKSGIEERTYLVPKEEYANRDQFGFVIDEYRHTRYSEVAV
jgi:hypothetical protein